MWGARPVGKSFARELGRTGVEVAAFVEVDPRKLGRVIHGAPVVPQAEAPRFAGSLALGAVVGGARSAEIREGGRCSGPQRRRRLRRRRLSASPVARPSRSGSLPP